MKAAVHVHRVCDTHAVCFGFDFTTFTAQQLALQATLIPSTVLLHVHCTYQLTEATSDALTAEDAAESTTHTPEDTAAVPTATERSVCQRLLDCFDARYLDSDRLEVCVLHVMAFKLTVIFQCAKSSMYETTI
jgi:hypothetical protein